MAESMAPKIAKVLMSFSDESGAGEMQYEAECLSGEGFKSIEVPFDPDKYTPENFRMRLVAANGVDSGPIDYELFKSMVPPFNAAAPNPQLLEAKNKNELLRALPEDFFRVDRFQGKKFATMSYSDVTERDMFGYDPVKALDLNSEHCGMWSWSGLRKLEFEVDGLCVEQNASDFTQRGCMYWKIIERTTLPEPQFEDGVIYNEKTGKYTVYCNTNELGRLIEEYGESACPGFKGRFELHFGNNMQKEAWGFPVSVYVHDTNQDKLASDSVVSIDFGTSSTCAAFQPSGNIQLLRLSGDLKTTKTGEKVYENPTNLMLYDWDAFYSQWSNDNPDTPILCAPMLNKDNGELDIQYADYDSGYTVDKIFQEIDDARGHRKMAAILTRLKSIPKYLANGDDIKFVPYKDVHGLDISVVDDPQKEDKNHFNPIRFYGYLLGRIINNPARHCYYKKYYVSYPVKFDSNIREIIRSSLADGILRSLPRPVRENMDPYEDVKMEYAESVACLGALIPSQLHLREDGSPQIFAIFDLGGGTLDTAFGIYRAANDDEMEVADYTIQLLGIGGDPHAGGETLIHRLAFKIYRDNKDELQNLKIPFQLPLGEPLPADLDETLIRRRPDKVTEANLRTMVEKLCRPMFQYNGDHVDGNLSEIFRDLSNKQFGAEAGNSVLITLRDKENQEHEGIRLTVDGIDDFIENAIKEIIANFKKEMFATFEQKWDFMEAAEVADFTPDDVAIFLGGNTSRQHFVKEVMNEEFPGSLIKMIGEEEDGSSSRNPSERITVKTAVAFGQLSIGQFFLDKQAMEIGDGDSGYALPPFPFYVLFKDMGTGEVKKVIEKNENTREWVKANLVDRDGRLNLFYTTDPSLSGDKLKPITDIIQLDDSKKRTLFLRVYEGAPNTLEYRLGSRKDSFSADEAPDETYTFKLKEY